MSIPQYHGKRRIVQIGTIVVISLIAATGLFRIDLTTAVFTIFGREVWWSNFAFTFGLGLMIATLPILTYMTIGTVWCGWACPQNTLSEWANNLTHRFLGKRASVDIDSELKVAAAKNKPLNWLLLGLIFLAVAMLLAVVPFLFFYSWADAWSLVTHGIGSNKALFVLYCFLAFLLFIDIAVVRHFFCDYICVYRIGQRIFKTRDALQVSYDSSRSADCTKCNYCHTNCVTSIEPTNIAGYDSCINCGECIDACDRLHDKTHTKGLLTFELGNKKIAKSFLGQLKQMLARVNLLVAAIFLLGMGMMIWGVAHSQVEKPYVMTAAEKHEHQMAEQCVNQCEKPRNQCTKGDKAACFQAVSCQCQCRLELEPDSPQVSKWGRCVMSNAERAEKAAASKKPGKH